MKTENKGKEKERNEITRKYRPRERRKPTATICRENIQRLLPSTVLVLKEILPRGITSPVSAITRIRARVLKGTSLERKKFRFLGVGYREVEPWFEKSC
jgi:hypothetical protein